VVSDNVYAGSAILIVDDEESNVILLQRMLARAGYSRLTTTTDSREVARLVAETKPDLILLDLMMPFLDGYQVLEQLSARDDESYLPVLVLTADASRQALQRALSGGARDFLTKPFDQTELLLRVRNLLETRHLYLSLQRQVQSLEELRDEALQSIVFRDQTLSEVAHDMGQPLAALRFTTEGLAQAAQRGGAGLGDDVQQVIAATAQMTAMIAELSDLTRLQMGRELVLQRAPVDLAAVVGQQVTALRKTAGRRRIRAELPDAPITGSWDAMRLTRVVSNLLSNAARYTPGNGQIDVSVATSTVEGQEVAQLRVTDDGTGIPADELPHVFERFYRASNVAGKVHGTGLGLASAKQIVEQHGGSIAITSELGAGTTVTVCLPMQ
jgi:signal transduction histidine kinase